LAREVPRCENRWTMSTINNLNGATISYRDEGHGPAVLLLHGFPLDGRMWDAQVPALAASGHRVIAPDFRGFGRSQPPAGAFSIESLADDVHALAQQLIGATGMPFVLAGLSMGGYVSLAYARKYTDTLRALVLVDTKAESDTPEGKEGRAKMIQLAREKGSVAIGDAMQPKLLSPDTIQHKPAIVKALRAMTDANPAITLEHALAAMRDRPDQSDLLPKLKVPTLIVVGDGDVITPPAVAESMQRAIPGGAHLAVIRGAGHMSPMEQPEQVNRNLIAFLSRI
jgi:pimeloyl-ACP methyl ester carboxylesterase